MEHKDLVELENQGKLLIGVDRAMARRFYTDISLSEIKKETGESVYFEKLIIWFFFLTGPSALLASMIISLLGFNWLGLISLIICPIIYFSYSSSSVRGDSKLIGITILLFLSLGVHAFGVFSNLYITVFVSVFLFSLWCVRFLYSSSTFLLRLFVIRNKRAYEYLSDHLAIRSDNKSRKI